MTSRPPCFPISPGRASSSSEELACGGNPSEDCEKTPAPARSRPQPSHLPKLEYFAILTSCPRQSSSPSSLCLRPAPMHSRALLILQTTPRLPMPPPPCTRIGQKTKNGRAWAAARGAEGADAKNKYQPGPPNKRFTRPQQKPIPHPALVAPCPPDRRAEKQRGASPQQPGEQRDLPA